MAKDSSDPVQDTSASVADVQKTVDANTKQGFEGKPVDETPRENYTVPGVTSGKPTPETTPS